MLDFCRGSVPSGDVAQVYIQLYICRKKTIADSSEDHTKCVVEFFLLLNKTLM